MLRRHQTDAENRLWRLLRNRRLNQFKFRRQYSIPPYVVDFVCVEAGLVIEIDGGQHQDARRKDEKRSRYLAKFGYRTVRYWDNDVLVRTDSVLEAILLELNCPSPPPLSQVERGSPARTCSAGAKK